MSEKIVIEVCERLSGCNPGYHAQICGKPELWACGETRKIAIGDLVMTHPEVFGIQVEDLGKQAR